MERRGIFCYSWLQKTNQVFGGVAKGQANSKSRFLFLSLL